MLALAQCSSLACCQGTSSSVTSSPSFVRLTNPGGLWLYLCSINELVTLDLRMCAAVDDSIIILACTGVMCVFVYSFTQ